MVLTRQLQRRNAYVKSTMEPKGNAGETAPPRITAGRSIPPRRDPVVRYQGQLPLAKPQPMNRLDDASKVRSEICGSLAPVNT